MGFSDGAGPAPPENPIDYYFIGLANYYVAKRGDSVLATLINVFPTLFPDLDGNKPYAAAERLLRRGIGLEAENFWLHFVLGRTLISRGDSRGAELAFNSCIALDPNYARGYEQRSLALAHQWRKSASTASNSVPSMTLR